MRRWFSDRRLLVLGLVAVVIFSIVTAATSPRERGTLVSVDSVDPDGARALRLWLESSGYEVRELVGRSVLPEDLNTLFILAPRHAYTRAEALRLQEWVREGHLLIITGPRATVNSVLEAFEVELDFLRPEQQLQPQTAPALQRPPLAGVTVDAFSPIITQRLDARIHVEVDGAPVLVQMAEGLGQVWIVGTVRPFTNLGLQDAGSAELILNMLADQPRGTVLGFDEALRADEPPQSLTGWFLRASAGQGILLAAGLTLVFLGLRGRRFGRPFPLREDRLRREPVEYIQAMGNLLRRSGHALSVAPLSNP
ncbi:MAG: DUF4350 domain-containing protein, partial [Anaerolineae bacterium]|nr:DUF4350 domain-containing protein [Anaerolineae bacterium]